MKPESMSYEPLVPKPKIVAESVDRRYRPRFDQAMEPGPLRLGGREYFKGVAVLHSRSSVVFLLPEPFAKLTAVVGIDDRVRPHGNVRLVIHGDDRILFDKNIAGTEEPLPDFARPHRRDPPEIHRRLRCRPHRRRRLFGSLRSEAVSMIDSVRRLLRLRVLRVRPSQSPSRRLQSPPRRRSIKTS